MSWRTAACQPPGVIQVTVAARSRDVDGGVTATGVLSRERGNLITISSTL